MTETFRPRVRLMEMARRNRTTRKVLMRRENPQVRKRLLGSWNSPKENDLKQMTLWTKDELSNRTTQFSS